jgi:circadian clock protein KaiB
VTAGSDPDYCLRLYITGATPHSMRAVTNINRICDEFLPGRVLLEIIDVYQQPELAGEEQIIAAPTLIKVRPLPLRRMIGDLSNTEKVLAALGISRATV